MRKIQFNNGFVTAIGLFLEHRDNWQLKQLTSDFRLYTATDHIFDMEIPESLSDKLKKRIIRWRNKCFKYRLVIHKNSKLTDSIFKEGEQILKAIDEEVFGTKKVVMWYR